MKNQSRKSTVILIEDNEMTRNKLVRAISQHACLELVGTAASVREAGPLLDETPPDVALVDIGLPDGSGLDLIARATRIPSTLAMVITVFADEKTVINAIEAGACGYLLKDDGIEQMGNEIEKMLDGGSPISPKIARHILQHIQGRNRRSSTCPGDPTLTDRQTSILELIAMGFSNDEIASDMNISPHTVRNHIRTIYNKLGVNSRTQAVYEGQQLGLIK